eukprot:15354710-Ditylum_brightwellii.AAC.2
MRHLWQAGVELGRFDGAVGGRVGIGSISCEVIWVIVGIMHQRRFFSSETKCLSGATTILRLTSHVMS